MIPHDNSVRRPDFLDRFLDHSKRSTSHIENDVDNEPQTQTQPGHKSHRAWSYAAMKRRRSHRVPDHLQQSHRRTDKM
jgi:hypothetical protein